MNSLVDKFYNKTKKSGGTNSNGNVFLKNSGNLFTDKLLGRYCSPTGRRGNNGIDSSNIGNSSLAASGGTTNNGGEVNNKHGEEESFNDGISSTSSGGSVDEKYISAESNVNVDKSTNNNNTGNSSSDKNTDRNAERSTSRNSQSNAYEMTVLLQILQRIYDDIMQLQQLSMRHNTGNGDENKTGNEIYNILESPELGGLAAETNKKDISLTKNSSSDDNQPNNSKKKLDEFSNPDDFHGNIQDGNSRSLLDFQIDYNLKNYDDNNSRSASNINAANLNGKNQTFSDDMNILEEKDKEKGKLEAYLRSSMLCFFDQIDKFSIIQANSNDKLNSIEARWTKEPQIYSNDGTGSGQLFDKEFLRFKKSRKTQQCNKDTYITSVINGSSNSGFTDQNNITNVPINYCSLPDLYKLSDENDKILKANELQFLKFKKLLLSNNESTLTILKNFLVVTIKLLNLKVGGIISYSPEGKNAKEKITCSVNDQSNEKEENEEDEEDEFDIEDCLRDVNQLEKTLTQLKLEIEKNSELLMKAADEKQQ